MNTFDRFLIGDIENIDWCFENLHFKDRLDENGITREYVVDCLFEKEPVTFQHLGEDKYSVVFIAPQNKDYKEIRLIMKCKDASIDLITVMRNEETTTNRQNKQYQSQKKKDIEKKKIKAISKRKW